MAAAYRIQDPYCYSIALVFLGFRGSNCEVDIDLCAEGLCKNSTNCTETTDRQNVTCVCQPGKIGPP